MSTTAVLAAAVGTWLGIQTLRFTLAMIIWNVAEDNTTLAGEYALAVWAVGVAGVVVLHVVRAPRLTLWLTAAFALLVVLRQMLPGESSSPALAFASWILWIWWLPAFVRRAAGAGVLREAALGAAVGVALEVAGQIALHGLDLELVAGPASVVAALVLAALFVVTVASVEERGRAAAGAWGAFALFPFLFIELTFLANLGRIEVDGGLAPIVVQLDVAIGIVAGLALAALGVPRAVRLALGAAAIVLLAAGQNIGALLALTVPVAEIGLALALVAAFEAPPARLDARIRIGAAAGSVALFVFMFVFYSYRDITDWLWPVAAVLVVAPGAFARATAPRTSLRPALAAAAAIAGAIAVAAIPASEQHPAASSGPDLVVLLYNQHQGLDYWSVPSAPALADRIESANADIVALQEVNRGWDLSAGIDELAYLRWRLPQYHAVYGRMDTALFGNAILSRYPIAESGVEQLPHLNSNLLRGYVWANVDGTRGRILFVSTHFTAYEGFDAERAAQADAFAAFWAKRPRSILAGDYNAHPGEVTVARLLSAGLVDAVAQAGAGGEFTYSSGAPHERIDYVFTSPDVSGASARILEGTASDHRPVLVILRLP